MDSDDLVPAFPSCEDTKEKDRPPLYGKVKRTWTEEEMKEFWRKKKQDKKARERALREGRRQEEQQRWEALSEEERKALRDKAMLAHEARRQQEEAHDNLCSQRLSSSGVPCLAFDLGFLSVMNDADCRSTMSQIKFSYSTLKRSAFPFRPALTSFDHGHAILENSLANFEGFRRFPPAVATEHWATHFADALSRNKVIYLTADTETTLDEIEPDAVYVVGAFVDHNSKKGLTRDCAVAHGARMARLPLVESIEVGHRCKVFTINHVVEILVRYVECKCWAEAFSAVLPTRRLRHSDTATAATNDECIVEREVHGGKKRSRTDQIDADGDLTDSPHSRFSRNEAVEHHR